MKILDFMNGCYLSRHIQVRSLVFFMSMMMLHTNTLADQSVQALDKELLEFLSLYEADDEDLLDLAIDAEISRKQVADKKVDINQEAE